MPFLDLQESAQQYFDEIDFSEQMLEQAWKDNNIDGVYQYMLPFDVHAIKRGVSEHSNCVIRLGALQPIFDDATELQSISDFLAPYTVILLQPVEDKNESIKLLRNANSEFIDGKELNEYFLTHRSNFELAKHTVYTKAKTPEQTAQDVLRELDAQAQEIILIGAQSVGKTTVGAIVAEKLAIPKVSVDELRWKYYDETGWSPAQDQEIAQKEGFVGVYRNWKKYDVHAVERILHDYKNCVIDFGAGQSVYENAADLDRVSELLAPYPNVIHLLPSPDVQESIDVLHRRRAKTINGIELFEFLITNPSYEKLADHVVYTDGKTHDESKNEVLKTIGRL